MVAQLGAADPRARAYAFDAFERGLLGFVRWQERAHASAAHLLDGLAGASDPGPLLVALSDLLGVDHVRGWLRPSDAAPADRVLVELLAERAPDVAACFAHGTPHVRAAATVVAAMLPDAGGWGDELVAASSDAEAMVRGSALVSLARFGTSVVGAKVRIAEGLEDPSAFVRGAAALASIRAGDPLVAVRGPLLDGLASSSGARWPWFDGLHSGPWLRGIGGPDAFPRALVAMAASGRETVDAWIDFAAEVVNDIADPFAALQATKILIVLFGWDGPITSTFQEMTDRQRRIAERIADTSALPGAGFGFPAAGAVRRRWAGLATPGPLEQPTTPPGGVEVPFWRAWAGLQASGVRGNPLPPALDAALHGVPRWQAIVEYAAKSFSHAATMTPADVERELARTPSTPVLVELAEQVADDLADRAAACRAVRDHVPVPVVTYAASTLLFVPLLEAGRPFAPSWAPLVYVGTEPRVRWVLERLSVAEREEVLMAWLELRPSAGVDELRRVMLVADLAPTERIASSIFSAIGASPGNQVMMGPFRGLADRHEAFRNCLA